MSGLAGPPGEICGEFGIWAFGLGACLFAFAPPCVAEHCGLLQLDAREGPQQSATDEPGTSQRPELSSGAEVGPRSTAVKKEKLPPTADGSSGSAAGAPARHERTKRRLKDRKKEYLMMKKRKTGKRGASDKDGHAGLKLLNRKEVIRFGDVVQAPPKLNLGQHMRARDTKKAGQEAAAMSEAARGRLRQQVVDSYRQRKGWHSRPGAWPVLAGASAT
eukprot:SM000041S15473  [mRNA]  locus=s41:246204:247255:- [translate_table: standard]